MIFNRQLVALTTLLMIGPTIGVPASLWHHHIEADSHAEHHGQEGDEGTPDSHDGCALCLLACSPVVTTEIPQYFAGLVETGDCHPFVAERQTSHTLDTHPARGPPAASIL